MPGEQISLATAGAVLAYGDLGHSTSQIGAALGIAGNSVWRILNGDEYWAEKLSRPVVEEYRKREKELFRAAQRLRAAKCLEQFDKTIDKASAYQSVGMYAWLRDQDRLDAGEATVITQQSIDPAAVSAIDKLAGILEAAVKARQARDITDIQASPATNQTAFDTCQNSPNQSSAKT